MSKRALNKMNKLTNERIYQVTYLMFVLQSKLKM